MTEQLTSEEHKKKIWELIKDIKVALLTTEDEQGKWHSRPMYAIDEEFDGTLWYFTSRKSRKIQEIERNQRVLLNYSEPKDQHYVSLYGTASISEDKAKIKQFWSEGMRTWFPQGLDDPDLILLHIEIEQAEYWDAPSSALVYAYGYIKARLTGERPYPGDVGKVNYA